MSAGWGGGASSGVPRGFNPETAAAVGTRDYWVLGEYPCTGGWCLALVRSTDSGKHFRRAGLPPLSSQGTDPTLEFANARDGFAYIRYGGPLYATHDGGGSWHRAGPVGHVLAFAVGGGHAYVVTTRHRLERSPVSHDSWLVLRRAEVSVWLAARGSHVWLLGGPEQKHFDSLARSSDSGRTFTTAGGPCIFELGGSVVPAGRGVVWAVCPTGMMAGLSLSTNGGRTFPARRSFHDPGGVRLPGLTNGASIFPISARAAVLYPGSQGPLLVTRDTGKRWTRIEQTARVEELFWLSFTTTGVGSAVVTTRSHPNRGSLWRTTDGGATWRDLPIR